MESLRGPPKKLITKVLHEKKRWKTTGPAHIKLKYPKPSKRPDNIYCVDMKKFIVQATILIFSRFVTVKEASIHLHRLSIKSEYIIFEIYVLLPILLSLLIRL